MFFAFACIKTIQVLLHCLNIRFTLVITYIYIILFTSFIYRELSIHDLEEYIENIHNCLDDIWKIEEMKYPQTRMEHLFEVIGNSIVKLIQRLTSNMNVWCGDYYENVDLLKMCEKACSKWIKVCEQLTVLYWPNYPYNKWIGSKYLPEYLILYDDHIKEVSSNNYELHF